MESVWTRVKTANSKDLMVSQSLLKHRTSGRVDYRLIPWRLTQRRRQSWRVEILASIGADPISNPQQVAAATLCLRSSSPSAKAFRNSWTVSVHKIRAQNAVVSVCGRTPLIWRKMRRTSTTWKVLNWESAKSTWLVWLDSAMSASSCRKPIIPAVILIFTIKPSH